MNDLQKLNAHFHQTRLFIEALNDKKEIENIFENNNITAISLVDEENKLRFKNITLNLEHIEAIKKIIFKELDFEIQMKQAAFEGSKI